MHRAANVDNTFNGGKATTKNNQDKTDSDINLLKLCLCPITNRLNLSYSAVSYYFNNKLSLSCIVLRFVDQ